MKTNVGNKDKTVRIIIGILVIAAGVYYQSWWGVVGFIPLITGAISFCPLYSLFGISTCRKVRSVT